jgi:hypothetical protein
MAFKAIKLTEDQLNEYVESSEKNGNSDERFAIALFSFGTMVRYYLKTTDWSFKAGCKNIAKEFKRSLGFSPVMVLAIIVTMLLPLIMTIDATFKIAQLYKNRKDILTRNVEHDAGRRQVKRSLELYRKYSK